jgi:hypothetical protein
LVRPDGLPPYNGREHWGLASLACHNLPPQLDSVAYHNLLWPARKQLTAICLRVHPEMTGNPVPQANCTCGIYAYKNRKTAETLLRTMVADVHNWPVAYGSVNLWGRLIECQDGYRAEHAYPQAVFFEPSDFLDQYGVEVLPFDQTQVDTRISNTFKLESRCSGLNPQPQQEQTTYAFGYSVMVKIKVADHHEWTTWMTYATYSEATAHARAGSRIVAFRSREWEELLRQRVVDNSRQ